MDPIFMQATTTWRAFLCRHATDPERIRQKEPCHLLPLPRAVSDFLVETDIRVAITNKVTRIMTYDTENEELP